MTLREEFQRLHRLDRQEMVALILVAVLMMGLGLYLDHSRFFAFGVVPAITIHSIASKLDIGIRRTPRFYVLMILLMVLALVLASWVISSP